MHLSVVVPCFDEKANILRFEDELFPVLDNLGIPYEVVAVDDGSSDGSFEVLKKLGLRQPKLRSVAHAENRGLGAALRTGFAAAKGDWIVTLDADLTFSPSLVKDLLARQKETGADMVGGSPFLSGGGFRGVPWARSVPSLLVNVFYRGLFDRRLTAYTPILRLYRASLLRALPLASEGFEINAEIAARLIQAQRRFSEIPAELSVRSEGVSKLNGLRELRRHACLIIRLQSRP